MSSTNNIEALREARGWKRPQLAKLMGTTPQQVERLEKGQRRLSQDWIDKAADAFKVPATDIIQPDLIISDEHGVRAAIQVKGTTRVSPGVLREIVNIRRDSDQPRMRDASEGETVAITALDLSYSMGPGTHIDGYIEESPVEMDIGFLRRITRSEFTRLRLARGVGDSMFPTLLTSDVVLIDTTQNQLTQQDRVYAISLYGAAAIKRLRRVGADKILVKSDNPAVDDQEVDAQDVYIDGRVIWFGRDL